MWSYLQLEKYRNFQNNMHIVCQKQIDSEHSHPTAAELLRQSSYDTTDLIINEFLTMPLPTFICTEDSYFREKELHLNTMVNHLGLPSLFITLSMVENKWEHLKEILRNTDNQDMLPTNCPFHVTCHFINRSRSMKKAIWKDGLISGWGTVENFFERIEFQNRGAAHIHNIHYRTNDYI